MPVITQRAKFESALGQPDLYRALHELAEAFKREGMSQLAMYRLFDEFRAKLEHEDSSQYNAVLDMLDSVAGWGRPGIFGQELDRSLYDPAFMKGKDKA